MTGDRTGPRCTVSSSYTGDVTATAAAGQ